MKEINAMEMERKIPDPGSSFWLNAGKRENLCWLCEHCMGIRYGMSVCELPQCDNPALGFPDGFGDSYGD